MTTTCPSCGKPTSAKALRCVHCGGSIVATTTRGQHQAVVCPRCGDGTDVVRLGALELDLCRGCGGLWFDRGELEQLRHAATDVVTANQVVEALKVLQQHKRSVDVSSYLDCPVCGQGMARKNYRDVSGIMLDRCTSHGTFLDRDEAVRLIELIRDGGEQALTERASRHEREDLRRKLRSIEARQQSLSNQVDENRRSISRNWVFDALDFFLD